MKNSFHRILFPEKSCNLYTLMMEESGTDATLGARLRARRRNLGKTLTDIAADADVSMTYLSNLERGRGNPTLDVLTRIAEALSVDVGSLVGAAHEVAHDGSIDVIMTNAPESLLAFSGTDDFKSSIARLAQRRGEDPVELRSRVLRGMTASPRRSVGEPTSEDWKRLLDAYQLILDDS